MEFLYERLWQFLAVGGFQRNEHYTYKRDGLLTSDRIKLAVWNEHNIRRIAALDSAGVRQFILSSVTSSIAIHQWDLLEGK